VREREDAKTALDTQKNIVQIAVGQLASANSQVDQAQQNLAILKRKGVSDIAASKATLNQAQAAIRLATENQSQGPAYKQNLIALQGQVDATNAQLQQAQSKLADTVVRSTINGIVTARKSDPGALASPGTPILEVQYLDWVFISSTFPIDASAQIHNGQTAQVTIDALPGRKFSGLVTNINPAADPQSRQFGIKVRLENKNHAVRPGMYARVSIVTNKVDAGVVVPKEALLTDSSGNSTVVVVSDGIAHVNPVKIGARDDRGTQIIDGVRAGESVVVLTFNPLKDGQKVKATDLKAESGKKKSGTNSSNATKKPE
jgi:RND family efflux transporter MFP subunit